MSRLVIHPLSPDEPYRSMRGHSLALPVDPTQNCFECDDATDGQPGRQ